MAIATTSLLATALSEARLAREPLRLAFNAARLVRTTDRPVPVSCFRGSWPTMHRPLHCGGT